jgi:hypothetical protein
MERDVMLYYAILNEDGDVIPASILEWASFKSSNRPQCRIARDELFGFVVSTVFLGLNHQYAPEKEPLWFETMIFDRWKGEYSSINEEPITHIDIYMERYTTRQEAILGHKQAIRWLKVQSFFYQLALPWKGM